jgi:hypothetical protein
MAAQGNLSSATVPVSAIAAPAKPTLVLDTKVGRLLIPSFTDLFVIALIVWMFCTGAGWESLLSDADTGWHIRTGQYIAATHSVPTKDLFSYSKPGQPWFAWEWLTDVLYAGLFNWSGLKGIVLYSGLLIAGFATILLRHILWRGANAFIAIAIVLVVVGAGSIHFHARPHVVTLFLLPIGMWLIDADRRQHSKRIWLLVPLTALWTNLHGGFLALIACVGLLVIGTAIEAALEWKSTGLFPRGDLVRYSGLLLACSAATVLNPYGYGLHVHLAEYLRSDWIKNAVSEFQSAAFRSENMMDFELLLFAGIAVSGSFLLRRRVTEALWILYWAHSALTSARHIPLYGIVAAPFLASAATDVWLSLTAGASKNSLSKVLNALSADFGKAFQRTTVWLVLFVAALIVLDAPLRWPKDFTDQVFPAKTVTAKQAWLTSGRVFSTDQWSDYLIYRFYPNIRVFVDGRSDFYGEALGKDYLAFSQAKVNWTTIPSKYGFTKAMVPVDWPITAVLKERRDWRIVADDGKAILFEQNSDTRTR